MEDFATIDLEPGRNTVASLSPTTGLVAALVPFAFAAALIPLRGDLSHTAGILLVLPVVIFGITRGAIVGTIAAISAAIGFDLFLVAPYLHPAIDHSEDVIATLALLFVGILAGLVGSRLSQINRRSQERLRELTVLSSQAELVTQNLSLEVLLRSTSQNLIELLNLKSCRWETRDQWDPTQTIGQPTMLDNGQIIGRLGDLPDDRGQLPNPLELVVSDHGHTHGRFIVEPGSGRTSIEERRTAMTFCRLTASRLSGQTIQESE